MFDKYIPYGKGLHTSKGKIPDVLRAKIKEAYINSRLRFNEPIERDGVIIDSGRPHEKFLADFCSMNKDDVAGVEISLNEVQDIIDEAELEYQKAKAHADEIIRTNDIQIEAALKAKLSPTDAVYVSNILFRTGGLSKYKAEIEKLKSETETFKKE